MALTPINLLKQLLLRSPTFSTLPNAIDALQVLKFQWQQHRTYSSFLLLSFPSFPAGFLTGYACSLKRHNVGIPQSSVLELLVYSLCTHLQNDLFPWNWHHLHGDGSQAFISISDLTHRAQTGISNSLLDASTWVSHIIPEHKIPNMESLIFFPKPGKKIISSQ